jgi:hypothetical protein
VTYSCKGDFAITGQVKFHRVFATIDQAGEGEVAFGDKFHISVVADNDRVVLMVADKFYVSGRFRLFFGHRFGCLWALTKKESMKTRNNLYNENIEKSGPLKNQVIDCKLFIAQTVSEKYQ